MPEQLLHRTDVVAGLHRYVANECRKRVAARPLRDARPPYRLGDRPLNGRRVQVIPRRRPNRGSRQIREAGNTYCHGQSRAAFGYLRSKPPGSATRPNPRARSARCRSCTSARCRAIGSRTASGITVRRSFRPFPSGTVISRRSRSRSFTRRSSASSSLSPAPYNSETTSQGGHHQRDFPTREDHRQPRRGPDDAVHWQHAGPPEGGHPAGPAGSRTLRTRTTVLCVLEQRPSVSLSLCLARRSRRRSRVAR
jgi:hypothetical protein